MEKDNIWTVVHLGKLILFLFYLLFDFDYSA